MIGLPLNDHGCLGAITEQIAAAVEARDPDLVALAAELGTTEALVNWIRSMPQRDDLGDPDDGPRVEACEPSQRVDLHTGAPNCVERATIHNLLAEWIDPKPVRQLATIDTRLGKHTFPVENGAPVILDPRLPDGCLDCATEAMTSRPVPVDVHDAIAWTARLAEEGAAKQRNGVRLRNVEDLLLGMVTGEREIDEDAAEQIAWLLVTAEQIAERYGTQGVAVVRATADALRDVAEERAALYSAASRDDERRNLDIAGIEIDPAPVSALARVATRFGIREGAKLVRAQLATYGVDDDVLGLVEHELNREGLTLGELAPPRPATTTPKPAA